MTRGALILAVVCATALTAGVSPALGAFPGQNGRIVFDSDRHGGDFDLWTINPDGSNPVNLTAASEANDEIANWRADGRKIVFQSDRDTPFNPPVPIMERPDYELFAMNADGSSPRQLTFNEIDDEDPARSPDGRRIAFRRDLNPVPGETDYDIFVMNVNGRGERNLTNSPGVHDDHPNWSPDGRRIAFVSERDGDLEIYSMRPNGSNVRQLTFNTVEDEHPNWSPDGTMIAFNRNTPDSFDIYAMRAGGGGERRLTFDLAGVMPAWSPSGRRIAFASGDGCCDIFTMRADGSGQVNLTNDNGEALNFVPDWQPLVDDDDDDDHGDDHGEDDDHGDDD
jgi:Tol biopolymer transport system component